MNHSDAKVAPPVNYAGFVTRLVAFVIDLVAIAAALAIAGFVVRLLYHFFGRSVFHFDPDESSAQAIIQSIGVAAGFVAQVVYFVFFWTVMRQTPGMALLGLEVVRADGARLSVIRGIARYVGYWISAFVLFIGFMWILVDRKRQGWQDKLAGSLVIYSPDARAYHEQVSSIKRRLAKQNAPKLNP